MARQKAERLPSGKYRRRIYTHSERRPDGTLKSCYVTVTASSLRELNEKEAETRAEIEAGRTKTTDTLTVGESIERYVREQGGLLSPSTVRGYETIRRSAFPELMERRLCDITPEAVRLAVAAETRRKGRNGQTMTGKTIRNEYGLLAAVLRAYAPSLDLSGVRLPQKTITRHDLSTPEQIFGAVKGSDIELPVLLAMWLSFTASEIHGLTRSSISADGSQITVREVVVDGPEGATVKKSGKTQKRQRTLPLPPYIRSLIEALPHDQDRLVTLPQHSIRYRFERALDAAGLPPMTFHDLRHVNASAMAMLRIPDAYAQERGGWSSDRIMKSVYTQTFRDARAEADAAVDAFFEGVVGADQSGGPDLEAFARIMDLPRPKSKKDRELLKSLWQSCHDSCHEKMRSLEK